MEHEDNVREWDYNKFVELQQWLGRRPGNKHIDPFYLRRGMGNKAYCWDDFAQKWRLLSLGDIFYKREDGTVGHEKGVRT